jgi:hypothetical protein
MKPSTQETDFPLEISLTMSGNAVARFFPLLGEGILVKGPGGKSVEDFLVQTAGVPEPYLKARVQTVFLNGRALDDFRSAQVGDGATVALSAAMPGLAGAVLRRGGIYAPMRRQISCETQLQDAAAGTICVTLKLFNLIARELGPEFLSQGILLPAGRLRDFLERQGRWAWEGCLGVQAAGQPVSAGQVAEIIANSQWVRLSIHASDGRGGA